MMKPKCEVKCEWKDWHDRRVAKRKKVWENVKYDGGLVFVVLWILLIGYMCCYWGRDVADSEYYASRFADERCRADRWERKTWELREKYGEVRYDTTFYGNGSMIIQMIEKGGGR